jgi:hypothetical protein
MNRPAWAREVDMPRKVASYTHPAVMDLNPVHGILVQAGRGGMQRCKRQKPGFDDVCLELADTVETFGDAAGIHPKLYAGFLQKTEYLARIRALLPAIKALYEAMVESELYYEDAREGDIIRMVKCVLDAHGHSDQPGLLAAFEKTIKYRSQYAKKSANTRRKKKENG